MMALITQAAGDAVRVEAAIAADLPFTSVDQNQLEMALLNLCVNARDAMPNGGTLLITADSVVVDAPADELAAGSFVRISVSDTGQGMSADTLRRAAEPFYTTKSIGKGTGLGLSMVHGLAAQSGGRLVLASTLGHGTTATIWLPAEKTSATPALAVVSGPQEQPLRTLSVLLVDDDQLARVATAEMLIDLGHSVVEAESGDDALVALSEKPPFDLLVTDYLMPGMTGAELIRIARMTSPSLPALMISGYMDNRAFAGSGIPRLAKPYSAAELSRSIAATMAAAQTAPRRIEAV
jgi:CheY-like chemotaxis protein/anti-sigma regulatory factor (Ser/Thr protein kinase)